MGKIIETNKQEILKVEDALNRQHPEWKTIGVKVRLAELAVLNRQLSRLNYNTLGDLVKDLISSKLTRVTEDQQIDIMKTNLQTAGQITGLSGKPYDFYKQIDINDFHK
jgi:ATP-dependent exoDNAse (exonuclease V) alpha subunit